MANTLTNLIPTLVTALDVVSREQVGFIPSVNRDATADRVAKNQTLYSWATGAATLSNITAANVAPQASDSALTNKSIVIDNYKMADFYFTGEEEKSLGAQYGNIVTDLIEQRVRAIVNQVESDLNTAAYLGASRAYGTAGTTPFASTVGDTAQLGKILTDNGAPRDGRSLIIDTTAGAALRTLAQLTKANEAGTTMTLRDGELLNLNRFSIKESSAIVPVTAGAMTGALFNGAGAVGDTTITFDTGTVNTTGIVAGDVITITGTSGGAQKYVVATGTTSTSGTFTINAPGLRAVVADNSSITVNATSTRNVGFTRNALLLACRLPALNSGGDMASDRQVITDPRSGFSIEVSMYPQYRQVRYELAAAWGVKVIKSEHLAINLG